MLNRILRLSSRCWIATWMGWAVLAAQAQTAFPALTRPALVVKTPERQFMLAATQAGKRTVAVGERGLVVLSDNQGESWRQAQQVPVSITLTAVSFVNDKLGWAVGHGGTILNTTDGGDSWLLQANGADLAKSAVKVAEGLIANAADPKADQALKSAQQLLADGPDKPLLDVHFQDAQHGWVVGAYNLFFETRDGGRTWTSVRHLIDNPKEMHLYAIRSAGADVYLVGEQGQMHRSVDGGRSFQALKSPYVGSWFTLALAQDGAVVAGGLRGNLFRSANRGESWEPVAGTPPISFVAASAYGGQGVLVANQAGHIFSVGPDGRLNPVYKSPTYPLSSVMPLNGGGLLVTAATGVNHVPANQLKKGN